MRRCCCCVSVHAGACVLGILGVVLTLLELIVLVPYLLEVDSFNPIQENLKSMFYVFEDLLREEGYPEDQVTEISNTVEKYTWLSLLTETCFAAVFLIVCVLMVCGVVCKRRGLMIPYLAVQLLVVLLFIVVGIAVTVFLFFLNVVMACVALGVLLVASFLFLYYWKAVLNAFVELGNRDYMYSPAPIKPICNPGEHKYQPSAPQQFNME